MFILGDYENLHETHFKHLQYGIKQRIPTKIKIWMFIFILYLIIFILNSEILKKYYEANDQIIWKLWTINVKWKMSLLILLIIV